MTTVAQDIRNAAAALTTATWKKGAYVSVNKGALCMCAHGALQAQVNPEVKRCIAEYVVPVVWVAPVAWATQVAAAGAAAEAVVVAAEPAVAAAAAAARSVAAADYAAAALEDAAGRAVAARAVWASRPRWVKTPSYRGSLEAHYILGMVGLTAAYNDSASTTLTDVKEKFEQAAQLAEELGV